MKKFENVNKCGIIFIFLPLVIAFVVGMIFGLSNDNSGGELVGSIFGSIIFFMIFGLLAGFFNFLIAKSALNNKLKIFLYILIILICTGLAIFLYVFFVVLLLVHALKSI